ncbi:hypothetical protein, partial [Acinetobacter sp. HY1485]|uniref:hypothetical protein n=1 Tax=Acinetobacter sp. HY1485 TaxID=2970918 RepID=UPI0022B9479B
MIITTSLGKLAICPYRPLIEAVENWQYVTDIFEAVDSTEERIALRQLPRQTLKYSYAMGVTQIPAFFNLFYGAMRSQWAVPIWFEGQTLSNVSKDTLELNCTTSRYTFSKLALLWQSPEKWQVLEIDSINSNSLTLHSAVTTNFDECRLYPIKVGWISGDVSRNISGIHCVASATFVIDDLPNIAEEVPNGTFNGEDLCFKKLLLNGDTLETTLSQQQDIIDFGLGLAVQRTTWKTPRFAKPCRNILKNQQELFEFKQWLVRRMGQYRPFYMPSYESNLRLVSLNGNSLVV